MARKSFNEKLQDSKDMPKIVEITDEKSVERHGGTQMLIAPPLEYNELMAKVPEGKIITIKARDNMIKFEFNYDGSTLEYPCSIIDVLRDICTKAGVVLRFYFLFKYE